MKALAIAALLVGCGDGGGQIDAPLVHIDAFIADAPCSSACNPFDGLGCGARCTSVHLPSGQFIPCYLTCSDDLGTIPPGGACTFEVLGVDDCVAGTVCRVDTCVPYCSLGSIPCSSGICPHDEIACFRDCDPAAPDCDAGEQCSISAYADEGTGCVPIGVGAEGSECDFPEDCGAGLACTVVGSARRCVPMCLVAGPACVTGTCTPRTATEAYGFCL